MGWKQIKKSIKKKKKKKKQNQSPFKICNSSVPGLRSKRTSSCSFSQILDTRYKFPNENNFYGCNIELYAIILLIKGHLLLVKVLLIQ